MKNNDLLNFYSELETSTSSDETGAFAAAWSQKEIAQATRVQSRAQSGFESSVMALTNKPLSMSEKSVKVGRKQVTGSLKRLVQDILSEKLVERTIADKPNSRLQKYRLTKKGAEYIKKQSKKH